MSIGPGFQSGSSCLILKGWYVALAEDPAFGPDGPVALLAIMPGRLCVWSAISTYSDVEPWQPLDG